MLMPMNVAHCLPSPPAGSLSVHWESQTVLALVTVYWVAI
jgi:hypothetical protein